MAKKARAADGIRLFRIAGIQISIDFSWFIVFFLLIWSLSAGYFPQKFPGQPARIYWLAGTVATLLFFSSVLIHELAHSLMAISKGIKIPSITLFIFGGVSQLSEEAKTPQTELEIAIVGPLSSFALALVYWSLKTLLAGAHPLALAVLGYLALINVALGVFNLIPGFPLDGGRVLRSIWWWKKGSLAGATRVASEIGKAFALGLMIFGGMLVFAGALVSGLWFVFIGMFLRSAAAGSYQELIVRQMLEKVSVREVMIEDVLSVPHDLTISRLMREYFFRHGYKGFPVTKSANVAGVVTVLDMKDLSEEEMESKTAEDVMTPLAEAQTISPDASLSDALVRMNREGVGRLLVYEGENFRGMITRTGVLRFLEIRNIIGR
jgi:Zn-dependent protease